MEVHLDQFYTKYTQMTCQSFKALLFIILQKTKSKHTSGHEEETNAERTKRTLIFPRSANRE